MSEKGIFDDIEEAAEAEASGGPNYGVIIMALGIVMILAVVALKIAGPNELPMIGEYPQEIYTGDPYFSYHFFMGLIGGIVVTGIGGVMSMSGKPSEDFEEDFEDTDEDLLDEDVEEGICPTCGAVIPISSMECPECGEELEPADDEEEEDIFIGETVECPICAATVDSSSEECPECGEPLGGDVEEDDFFADL
ncbi:MAG: zinc ribbon domain-containing protein [Thermoplasmata archaeon]